MPISSLISFSSCASALSIRSWLMAQAHHPGFLAEPQDLHKQRAQGLQVAAAELTDPAVVRLLVAGEHPEGQILVAGPLDLAG